MTEPAISRKAAERRVAAYLARARPELEVLTDETREYKGVWLVAADSHAYARSRDIRDMMIGGGAILVDSRNGEMFSSGSAETPEYWVERYLVGNLAGLERLELE